MSTSKEILPCALFDTLEYLANEIIPAAVGSFLQRVKVSKVLQDYQITREFLLSYAGSADTFSSYRREVERLLQWSWLIAEKSLAELDRNTLRLYLEFINKPDHHWIMTEQKPRFIDTAESLRVPNPDWRPFLVKISKAERKALRPLEKKNYRLSSKSLQALFACLSTFFTYLQQENYVEVNPIQLIRQKSRYIQKEQQHNVTRKLTRLQWESVIATVQARAETDPDCERLYFMMSAFYLLGLRISELAETPKRLPLMRHFAPDKEGRWWFSTVGKGNKARDIAVPDEMLLILKRYRQSLGLTALPTRGEQTPLLPKKRGDNGLGTRQIRYLVQACFDHAIDVLNAKNLTDEALDLQAATVHWLRHTAISADIEYRPREHVRDDAGHVNASTTEQYIDVDRSARHESARKKKLQA